MGPTSVSSGVGANLRLARTVHCSVWRETPAKASMTLRLTYLPRPKATLSEPSRAAAMAHTFSVQARSLCATRAKVSAI